MSCETGAGDRGGSGSYIAGREALPWQPLLSNKGVTEPASSVFSSADWWREGRRSSLPSMFVSGAAAAAAAGRRVS